MSATRTKRLMVLLALLTTGMALQVGANGCVEYWVTGAVTSLDFCSVVDCTGSTFFDFCTGSLGLFVDCPNLVPNP